MTLATLVVDIGLVLLLAGLFRGETVRRRKGLAGSGILPNRLAGLTYVLLLILMSVPYSYLWSSVPGTLLLLMAAATLTLRPNLPREGTLAEGVP
ncbi:MAG: hypothetical protein EA350_08210 [Gemmatimonadales bacterium]|nr:MAG: hypothetical protein EA350_08210 [Gemmatimonadales bacterium]